MRLGLGFQQLRSPVGEEPGPMHLNDCRANATSIYGVASAPLPASQHESIIGAYQTCRTERCRRCVAGRSAAQRGATRPVSGSARRRPLRRANVVCIYTL